MVKTLGESDADAGAAAAALGASKNELEARLTKANIALINIQGTVSGLKNQEARE